MSCTKAELQLRRDQYYTIFLALKQAPKPLTSYEIAEITGLSPLKCANFLVHGCRRGDFKVVGFAVYNGKDRPLYQRLGVRQEVVRPPQTTGGKWTISADDLAWMAYYQQPRLQRVRDRCLREREAL